MSQGKRQVESKASYSVQAFRAKGKGLEPDTPQQARDEPDALRKLERLAQGKAGAVALRQDGDPELGDYPEPVVLKVIGRVPPIFRDLPF